MMCFYFQKQRLGKALVSVSSCKFLNIDLTLVNALYLEYNTNLNFILITTYLIDFFFVLHSLTQSLELEASVLITETKTPPSVSYFVDMLIKPTGNLRFESKVSLRTSI